MAPLLVVDLPWLLYRSFFALPSSLKDGHGRPTGALLGAIGAILTLTADGPETIDVRAVAICTGAEQAAYRVELYPPYHAHREPMPAALAEQWVRAPELTTACGWPLFDAGELEADDAMYSLARAERDAAGQTLVMTADRDLYGAVDDATAVLALRSGGRAPERIDEPGVVARLGVRPDQVADLIALRGDPSDGIPGARGVGAKTAAALLEDHGTLDGVLDAARRGELRPRVAAALSEQAELLRRFREVATLQRIELEPPPDGRGDFAAGAAAVREAGMARLATRLEALA